MTGAPRRGLVLGGGGVLGAAWMVGALQALQDETGGDVREFEAFVGTSAGSVLVALLGAGVSVEDLVTHQRDGQLETGPLAGFHFDYETASGGDRPIRPRSGIGSRELLLRNARQLRQLTSVAKQKLTRTNPRAWTNRPVAAAGGLIVEMETGQRPRLELTIALV